MEEDTQIIEPQQKQSIWTTVTPFSKYLAMILFVALPFIGGLIGYKYTPTKIVEVEKVVVKEVEVPVVIEDMNVSDLEKTDIEESDQENIYVLADLQVGEVVNGMTVVSVEPFRANSCLDEGCTEEEVFPMSDGNIKVVFEGEVSFMGNLFIADGVPGGEMVKLAKDEFEKLPRSVFSERNRSIKAENPESLVDIYGEGIKSISIDRYTIINYPAAVTDLINIIDVH